MLLVHHALDVLDDHDGVVDQETDREHHAEHGQRVDGVAHHRQHPHRTEEHHRHGDRGNDGGAEVLQEQQHHDEDERNRLGQRLHHFFDGDADERRGVERVVDPKPMRERGLELLQALLDGIAGGERVCPGR